MSEVNTHHVCTERGLAGAGPYSVIEEFIKLKDHKKIVEEKDRMISELAKALSFYAHKSNWKLSRVPPHSMYESEYLLLLDGEEEVIGTRSKRLIGGKIAREVLRNLGEK